MNRNQVKGRADQVKGKVKDAAGDLTGDKRLDTEGKLDQAKGKAQAGLGDAKEKLKRQIAKA